MGIFEGFDESVVFCIKGKKTEGYRADDSGFLRRYVEA